MQQTDGAAPAWLFSFVDLAFLMLIAMTQLAPDPGAKIPNLGEMIVPKVGAAASTEMGDSAAEVWQLRVHPPEDGLFHNSFVFRIEPSSLFCAFNVLEFNPHFIEIEFTQSLEIRLLCSSDWEF